MRCLGNVSHRSLSLPMVKIGRTKTEIASSQDLHSEWEEALGHPLTPTEFEELKENLSAFFNLLHDWHIQDQLEASAADGACIDSDAGGGLHD